MTLEFFKDGIQRTQPKPHSKPPIVKGINDISIGIKK
jgi:hypothetical protein